MSEKKFNRDSPDSGDYKKPSHKNTDVIKNEVRNLIKTGKQSHDAWSSLKQKYGNDERLINDIMDELANRTKYIYKKARKFKEAIENNPTSQLTKQELFSYAVDLKKKYELSNPEFEMFVRIVFTNDPKSYGFELPATEISKALGFDPVQRKNTKLNIKPDQYAVVEDIVNAQKSNALLHNNIILQSYGYRDCAPEALTGRFEPQKQNAYSHVHPIIAAMFLPKIELFENLILRSNMGKIVNNKYQGKPIETYPDLMLYLSMIHDHNDNVYKINNAMQDIKNRFDLQVFLWKSVYQLRQGRYYNDSEFNTSSNFLEVIQKCRNIIVDSPDIMDVADEGTIFRKILSAFSLYPTYINLFGVYPNVPNSQIMLNHDLSTQSMMRVPMVVLRLPLYDQSMNVNPQPIRLTHSLTQLQWFIQNKVITPKIMNLLYSNDVLCFYVGRRYHKINTRQFKLGSQGSFHFNNLPVSISSLENVNKYPIDIEYDISIRDDIFTLRSVVLIEEFEVPEEKRSFIMGNSCLVRVPQNPIQNISEQFYYYNPVDPLYTKQKLNGGQIKNHPVSTVPLYDLETIDVNTNQVHEFTSFQTRASNCGTIFIYQRNDFDK